MWTDKIPGCFSSTDGIFAHHEADCERAFEMLSEAIKQETPWKTYLKELRTHIKTIHSNKDEVDKQMKRVKNLANYFKYED